MLHVRLGLLALSAACRGTNIVGNRRGHAKPATETSWLCLYAGHALKCHRNVIALLGHLLEGK